MMFKHQLSSNINLKRTNVYLTGFDTTVKKWIETKWPGIKFEVRQVAQTEYQPYFTAKKYDWKLFVERGEPEIASEIAESVQKLL